MADTMNANGGSNGFAKHTGTGNGSVSNGPLANKARDEYNKTSNEFSNLAASRKTPSHTTATNQTLTHYHSYFMSLLSWKDPRASGIAYVTIVSLILSARYLDVIRWGFKLSWMALGTTVAAEVLGKALLNNGITSQLRPRKYYKVSRETIDTLMGDVHELINFFVIEGQRILFAENIFASAAAFIAAFISYYLVKVVPYWGLAIIGTTIAFIAPLVYNANKELIDTQLKNASELISAQTAELRNAAGKHTSQVAGLTKQYMGDYSAKAQNMIHRRSSGPSPEVAQEFPAAPTHVPNTAPPASGLQESDFPQAPSGTLDETKEILTEVPAADGVAAGPEKVEKVQEVPLEEAPLI